jgi:carbon storage regulator
MDMLVLSRKPQERILIGNNVQVTVTAIHGDRVSIGVTAPKDVPVLRAELLEAARDGASSLTVKQVLDLQNSLALLLNHVRYEKMDADGFANLTVAKEFIEDAAAALERSRESQSESEMAAALGMLQRDKVAS